MMRVTSLLVPLLFLSACDPNGPEECICTLDFRAIRFAVVNTNGAPEPGVTVTIELVRTGEILDIEQPGAAAGVFTLIDDSFKSTLETSGDRVLTVGSKGDRGFRVEHVVGVDEPCRCHVLKISGPETVVLQ
jgi:hypothetical protein